MGLFDSVSLPQEAPTSKETFEGVLVTSTDSKLHSTTKSGGLEPLKSFTNTMSGDCTSQSRTRLITSSKHDADTIVGVDVNEDCIALNYLT